MVEPSLLVEGRAISAASLDRKLLLPHRVLRPMMSLKSYSAHPLLNQENYSSLVWSLLLEPVVGNVCVRESSKGGKFSRALQSRLSSGPR